MSVFCHLHCHTQFSLLDGAAGIKSMMQKAKNDNMRAVAITDHGNMFGAYEFVNEANKQGITPIVGCEFYLVEDRFKKQFVRGQKDQRYHQLLLAKNQVGYRNLSKLCSLGFIDGLYGKFPRIDKELLKQYKEGLIATSCCIGAEIPQAILFKGEEAAEKLFLEWLDMFGDDFYLELQRHYLENIDNTGISQEDINQVLIKWSKKYGVPLIATNDSHYVEDNDWYAHDILLCINTGDKVSTPKGDGKGFRFGFPNNEFYFKTQAQMLELFHDVKHAVENTQLIVDKITPPSLTRNIMLPNYVLPQGFADQNDYLRHLTFEGARKRYGEITAEIEERLNFELKVIKDMDFPGYFLIVQDFTTVARQMGVWVGPGRGSAAGSAVAYAVGITNVDPIRYNLLFERFLNPERISMPDIDIDFDDEGRQKIIDYVVQKYGKTHVAQIATYGTMAAKMAIRDVGRVLDLPLPETDRLAKMIPNNISLNEMFSAKDTQGFKEKFTAEDIATIEKLRTAYNSEGQDGEVLRQAKSLEGSVRNTGLHACGVIISREEITDFVPVMASKDSDLIVTQFESNVVENTGLLKMDFLGLKTLTILKDAIEIIKEKHGITINPDEIPFDDEETYGLFQRGETIGLFQYESVGMQKNLKELKPTNIEDLIAMNALYRPGPMQFIPNYVARKHGREEVSYPHPWLEELLKPTYGIMVYQEQIMQSAQIMAGYTLGAADILRRAMGKKKPEEMAKQRQVFLKGAAEKGVEEKTASEIFDMMERFAAYGFNRSHSAAYAILAYQTAYLKAHYPAAFMAAVLTHNMSSIKDLNLFLNECNVMNIKVLVPDINESGKKFTVNQNNEIRFGLEAIKGVGGAAVETIMEERAANGKFEDIFDVCARVNLRTVNKKSLENMAAAGAFDNFKNTYRAQYLVTDERIGTSGVELAIKYGNKLQEDKSSNQISLFGSDSTEMIEKPNLPNVPPFSMMEKLNREKEVVGIYLSGHPLDKYKREMQVLTNTNLDNLANFQNRELRLAVMVTQANHRISNAGNKFGSFVVEDLNGSIPLTLFGEDYLKFKHFFEEGNLLFIKANYQKSRWRDNDTYELKVLQVQLLEDAQKSLQHLTVSVHLHEITNQFIQQLHQLATQNPGNLKLHFEVRKNGYKVDFDSNFSLANTPQVFKALDALLSLDYKLS
ncbi:MAG: DNA polymerase III subunit alpha [Chitinophagales bacterium]|nr:DNA polymerase III subunit alpha [Bacteroidota bacterium]MCB9043765.1 DNA polymerase III subunit alpha [Chitinophagales bacterium]